MQWVRKKFLLLILIALVYVSYFLTHGTTQPTQPHVLSAQSNIFLFTQPEDGRQTLLSEINNAKTEILLEVYMLSDKQIIQALLAAKERGVSEKVILEKHPFGGGNINDKTYQELTADGVPVTWSSPSYALTHEKAMIIDNKEVFVLNQNLTAASFIKNREYDILDANPEDVKEARDIFFADTNRIPVTLSQSHLLVSPENSRATLIGLIKSTTAHIFIEMEILDDKQIIEELSKKAATIPVEIIIPDTQTVGANIVSAAILQKAGVQVRTVKNPYIHAKLLITDTTAYIGSINFSSDSMDRNRELGILLTDQQIVGKLLSDFTADWDNAIVFSSQ